MNKGMTGKHHTEETKKKMSQASKGKSKTKEHRNNISKGRKGLHLSEKHKKELSEINKGKHLSEETKHKISEFNKKKHLSEEHKNKIGQANKGEKIRIFCKVCNKEKYIHPCEIKKGQGKFCSRSCAGIWYFKHCNKKDTSIEIAIEKELIKKHMPYMKQVPIEGIALVDFLLSNRIIIQCDGDYWHSKEINKGRDIAQDIVLHFKGYKVYRFREADIKKSAERCINNLLKKEAICQR